MPRKMDSKIYAESFKALNMRELLRGDLVRLRYVRRYSACRVNHPETVAEHSFYVSLYASIVAAWCELFQTEIKISWPRLMMKAVIHDCEESRTGDWPREFKHSNLELVEALKKAAVVQFDTLSAKLFKDHEFNELVRHLWREAKDESIEGRIVSFADFLSVVSYIIQELESGNRNATEHIQKLEKYLQEFSCDAYNFLRPLIDQVTAIIVQEIPIAK